ncbi:MAG TPA: hypothetical protein PK264_23830, partial [Hyphomicrobiaceae bacterium]|nr:hypothetical protein [Hyphomicrobiaceae bacterium]
DIWGLSEVSPSAVKALVGELKAQFGENYDFALSEPDAPDSRQTTAVIWKRKTVTGRKEPWPAEIERLWHLDSRDDLEATDGQIFNRYPGLFRFTAESHGHPVEFLLVPLHLKAMDEGQKRRRLASKLLARAVREMRDVHGYSGDWVIGGDFNAELASDDFDSLLGQDFHAMSAEDERQGAMSYIKSPKSLIDHIFLSPNLARLAGDTGFFIVAKEKSVDNYARKLSDHRPVLVRLSLGEPQQHETHEDLDALADKLMAEAHRRAPGNGWRKPARRALHAAMESHGDALEAATYSFVTSGLDKRAFIERNLDELKRLVGDVNDRLRSDHGADASPVSMLDLAVLLNCEAGLKNGKVDPNHTHSLGERGLFPLPDNLRSFWNGSDAPYPKAPMALGINIYHFMLYLGRIKNKVYSGMVLYKGHFQHAGIKGVARREARLLAGIVHGY